MYYIDFILFCSVPCGPRSLTAVNSSWSHNNRTNNMNNIESNNESISSNNCKRKNTKARSKNNSNYNSKSVTSN